MRRLFIVAIVMTAILMAIADQWKIEWYKIGIIYTLGLTAMLFASLRHTSTRKAADIIEDMEKEILDAIETQPKSVQEILDYIADCKKYCREKDL
jgi:hypothetical protein